MNDQIKKYGFYMITKGLENGLGIVVMDIGKNIDGVKFAAGNSHRFNMSLKDFEKLLETNIIEFQQIVPQFVWKDLKKTYYKS